MSKENNLKETVIKAITALQDFVKALEESQQMDLFESVPRGTSIKPNKIDYTEAENLIKYLSKLRIDKGLTTRPLKINYDRKQQVYQRLKDSSFEEAKKVIDTRFAVWLNSPFEKYLQIETIFRASKYPKYVDEIGEIEAKKITSNWDAGNTEDDNTGEF